jgi:hypothetical protein
VGTAVGVASGRPALIGDAALRDAIAPRRPCAALVLSQDA